MQIYRYRKDAMKARLLLLCLLFVGAALATWFLWEPVWYRYLAVLWATVALAEIYGFFLWLTTKTAVFIVDAQSIGYRDGCVKSTIAWRDVADLTPKYLKATSGKTIFFKLGIQRVEDFDALTEAIVTNAGLVAVPRNNGPVRFWSKSAATIERAA